MSNVIESFLGTWTLTEYQRIRSDGQVTHPLGIDCVGCLVYTPDGTVVVQMMRQHRPPIETSNILGGTVEERAHAMEGYIAYAGAFELFPVELTVIHHIKCSLFPNWVGEVQKRYYLLSNDSLILTTPSFETGGKDFVARMTWNRPKRETLKRATGAQ